MIKKIDIYVIRRFLGTFVVTLSLFMFIIIVFDISEKLDDFIKKQAPLKVIIFDYYVNFVPSLLNLFSPIFIFISVIFFTSKLAQRSEIIAILASGVSYKRMLSPYILTAFVLGVFSYFLNGFIIPKADKKRVEFENTYIRNASMDYKEQIHRQIRPDLFLSIGWFNHYDSSGGDVSLEQFKNNKMVSKLYGRSIKWNRIANKWTIRNYMTRDFLKDGTEVVNKGIEIDTMIPFELEDIFRRIEDVQSLNNNELSVFIESERLRGAENVYSYITEWHKRNATPYAAFVLTIIGVCVSSKKSRGGLGVSLGLGIGISLLYLFLIQVFNSYGNTGLMHPLLAVWIPNIVFSFIAYLLYRKAQK